MGSGDEISVWEVGKHLTLLSPRPDGEAQERHDRQVRAFGELASEDVVAIAGPSISDNALIVAPLCDDARIPAINFSGGERTRSAVARAESRPEALTLLLMSPEFQRR